MRIWEQDGRRWRLAARVLLAAAAGWQIAADPAPPATPVTRVPADAALAILGHTVDGQDGKDIARIVDVLVDNTGHPVAAVIDFGGFLGVGMRKVAVEWDSLKFAPASKDHPIVLDLTMDQIRAVPAYREEQAAPVAKSNAAAQAPAGNPPGPASGGAPATPDAPAATPKPDKPS